MNIYQKLIEVRKLVDFLQKDTQGYQYKYVSGTSVLSSIRPKMDEIGLLLKTDVLDEKQDRYQWEGKDSQGKIKIVIQFVTKFKMKMTWINAEKPEETIVSDWFSSGEDEDPAKANGKAHTYGERYYLLKFFNIPTDNEDPDAFQKKQKEAKEKETKTIITPRFEASPLPTLKDLIIAEGIKRCGDLDKFKVWRVDNNLPEDLNKATSAQLQLVRAKITAYNPMVNGIKNV